MAATTDPPLLQDVPACADGSAHRPVPVPGGPAPGLPGPSTGPLPPGVAGGEPWEGATARQRFLLGRPVDANRASVAELDALPGVSRKVAEAWVRERRRRGAPFRRPADLLAVPGIKERRLGKLLPFLAPLGEDN